MFQERIHTLTRDLANALAKHLPGEAQCVRGCARSDRTAARPCHSRYCGLCELARAERERAELFERLTAAREARPAASLLHFRAFEPCCETTGIRKRARALRRSWRALTEDPVFAAAGGWLLRLYVYESSFGPDTAGVALSAAVFMNPGYRRHALPQRAWMQLWSDRFAPTRLGCLQVESTRNLPALVADLARSKPLDVLEPLVIGSLDPLQLIEQHAQLRGIPRYWSRGLLRST